MGWRLNLVLFAFIAMVSQLGLAAPCTPMSCNVEIPFFGIPPVGPPQFRGKYRL